MILEQAVKLYSIYYTDHAIAQAVSCQLLTAVAQICVQISPCGICGGHSGTGTGFSLEFFGFPTYNSTAAPYSVMYHLGYRQWARKRPQFHLDTVSPLCNNKNKVLPRSLPGGARENHAPQSAEPAVCLIFKPRNINQNC
jgi:hypothetical protein